MSGFAKHLTDNARRLLEDCWRQGIMVATAESCTGGLVSALLTEIPGSSSVFERGFVTYSNQAKEDLLGVSKGILEKHGAVSSEVAEAMARGALTHSNADASLAITGIAGPDGGTKEKPVGLVYIAVAYRENAPLVERCHFGGGRDDIRMAAVEKSLKMIADVIANNLSFG